MQPIKLSKNSNARIFLVYNDCEYETAKQYWFCPARFELIDLITHDQLLSDDERKGCIPVKRVRRAAAQRAFLEQEGLLAEWEDAVAGCPDKDVQEQQFWNIVESDYALESGYVHFEDDFALAYAENWCRENQIPFVETEEWVASPTHPHMFIDDVEDVLSYLKQGWSVEDYMNMLRQFNPDVEDFSAITPAIEAAVEQMKKDAGKQA